MYKKCCHVSWVVINRIGGARTEAKKALNQAQVAPSQSVTIDVEIPNEWSAAVISVKATYHQSATQGIRVLWLYSPDGTNFDSEEDAVAQGNYYDLSFAAGATRQATVLIAALAPYVRVVVRNMDTAYAATVDAWWWLLR